MIAFYTCIHPGNHNSDQDTKQFHPSREFPRSPFQSISPLPLLKRTSVRTSILVWLLLELPVSGVRHCVWLLWFRIMSLKFIIPADISSSILLLCSIPFFF